VTREGAVTALAAVVAVAVGTALGYRELVAVGLVLAGALATGAVAVARRPRLLVVPDTLLGRAREGEAVSLALRIGNQGRRAARGLGIVDGPRRARVATAVPAVPGGGQVRVTVDLPPLRRGRYPLGPVTVVRTDPLGLVARHHRMGPDRLLVVHPLIGPARDRTGGGRVRGPRPDPAPEPAGVRPHRPDDGARRVHWPTSVRRDAALTRLMVRAAEPEHPAVAVRLDTAAGSYPSATDGGIDDDAFDEAVRRSASTAVDALRRGRRVEVITTGGLRMRVGPGRAGRMELLDRLAGLEPHGRGEP
jgi:uncharacterized protein (DUF58 family)